MSSLLLVAFVAAVLLACVYSARGLSSDAQDRPANLASLQYPEEALLANPNDIYSMTAGLLPSPRVKGTLTYVEPLVVVMGGYNTDGSFMDDVHVYDTRVRKWSGVLLKRSCCDHNGDTIERMGATEESLGDVASAAATGQGADPDLEMYRRPGFEGDLPAARAEHAATGLNGSVYVFGGVSAHYGLSNDFYVFDPVAVQWSLIDRYGGQGPTRRAGHSLETDYDTQNLVLFGGRAELSDRTVGLADVWVFDTQSRKWEKASTYDTGRGGEGEEAGPAGRQHAACSLVHSVLFCVGGIDPASKMIFNDVWAFYLGTKKWVQISSSTGQTKGFAPPPLSHSTLLPVRTNAAVNATSFDHYDLLLFGGVGSGGSCGSASCGQAETSLGQVYRLPVSFDPYELDSTADYLNQGPEYQAGANSGSQGVAGIGVDGRSSSADVNTWRLRLVETAWKYARLSDNSDDAMLHGLPDAYGIDGASGPGGGGAFGRGRLLKTWGMEAVCFDTERSLMYELGGMVTIPIALTKAQQAAVELTGPSLLDTGNEYAGPGDSTGVADDNTNDAPLWDTHSQEHLRTTTQLPVNAPWIFEDGFERAQPQVNGTLRYLRTFRTYHISESNGAKENVVLQIEDHQGSTPGTEEEAEVE